MCTSNSAYQIIFSALSNFNLEQVHCLIILRFISSLHLWSRSLSCCCPIKIEFLKILQVHLMRSKDCCILKQQKDDEGSRKFSKGVATLEGGSGSSFVNCKTTIAQDFFLQLLQQQQHEEVFGLLLTISFLVVQVSSPLCNYYVRLCYSNIFQ